MRDHELPHAPRWITSLCRAANDAPSPALPSAWTRGGTGFTRRASRVRRPAPSAGAWSHPEPPSAA